MSNYMGSTKSEFVVHFNELATIMEFDEDSGRPEYRVEYEVQAEHRFHVGNGVNDQKISIYLPDDGGLVEVYWNGGVVFFADPEKEGVYLRPCDYDR